MAADESSGPPNSPPSQGDVGRLSGPDDAGLFESAETFDISTLRPGWRNVADSSRDTQPLTAGSFVRVPAKIDVSPTASYHPSNGISKGLIAAGTVALAVLIALSWLLTRSGNRTSDGGATQQAVVTQASPAQVSPAQVNPAQVDPAQAPPTQVNPVQVNPVQVAPAKVNPTQLNPAPLSVIERRTAPRGQRAAAQLEQTTSPVARASAAESVRMAPPLGTRTVSAGFAAPAVSPTTPPPVPADGVVQPGASRHETPPATPDATSAPSPAIAVTPPPASAAADQRLVAAALRRFTLAYERLDANAVADVWPHADRRALSRAFDSIESQQVYFERCDVQISGPAATASCNGWMTYVPKVGTRAPRSVNRRWDFGLQKRAEEWQIATAAVR